MEKIKAKLEETFLSRKFWGTVAIIVMVVVEDYGGVTPGAALKIQGALGLYIAGQAVADHGKEKAKIEAANGKPAE